MSYFEEDVYKKINIDSLIIFSIYKIEKKDNITFGKLVKECFTLFPKTFNLLEYPMWPDSRKLDRPIRSLKEKKIISENPNNNFSLTKLGEKKAIEVESLLKQKRLKI